jgi:serine/threonine protein kinase
MIQTIAKGVLSGLRDGDWKASTRTEDAAGAMDECSVDDEEDDRIEGTTSYLPPEVVMGAFPTNKADVWALGCLMYQCLSGRPPFFEEDDEATRQTIVSFNMHDTPKDAADQLFQDKHAIGIEQNARQMIKACLVRDPSRRPGMGELAAFDFFSEADVNVFSLHAQPAHHLDVGAAAPAPDAKWARRQFSSIWAPQPVAYDITLPDETIKPTTYASTKTVEPIVEGDEAMGYFSVSGLAPKQPLGSIMERLPPGSSS